MAVRFVADASTDRVRVAYAVGRRYGGAVERNLCRRRLRAIVAEMDGLAPGAYLLAVDPGARTLTYRELRERVFEVLRAVGRGRPA